MSNNNKNKLLVDLSKSIMPSAYSTNPAKYSSHPLTGNYFHATYLNGSKMLSHFSSPRSSRSSCSTYSSSTNSCSASCTSASSSSATATTSTRSTYSGTANSSSHSSSSSTSSTSSNVSLNLSSTSHTCDSSECGSNCSKAYCNGSTSVLSTSLSNNSNSEASSSSSSSSSYYSTDDQPDEAIYDDDEDEKNSNRINNSYICNSSHSSGDNSISTTKTSSTTIAKTTRSASKLSKQNDDSNLIDQKPSIKTETIELNNRVNCMWSKCKFIGNSTDVDDSLLEHIKSKHIFAQKRLKSFRCMWKECAVYKKPSCSFNWLERHVTDHIDTRPFLCIFNGCKRKFRTEQARERHVQSHINLSESQPASPVKTRNNLLLKSAKLAHTSMLDDKTAALITTAAAKLSDSSKTDLELPNYSEILKALSKKRKALTSESASKKFKKVQYKDFIDECVVSCVDSKLRTLNYESGELVLKANIIGVKPKTAKRKEMLLVEWTPANM